MARIGKDQHPRILRMVDSEHRKVAEVAAEYGCTPANIYALLGKLRREAPSGEGAGARENPADTSAPPVPQQPPSSVPAPPAVVRDGLDLFTLAPQTDEVPALPAKAGGRPRRPAPEAQGVADHKASNEKAASRTAAVPSRASGAVASIPARSAAAPLPTPGPAKKSGGLGAALAKPGVALMMRTADGDENMTPFRSLDDLLSAIKPILRAAARSPDAVWFSIQPVDLASLDSDAA